MAKEILLSIVTPAHNEELLVGDFVKNAYGYLKKNNIDGEIIAAENGSTDGTVSILKELGKQYSQLKTLHLDKGNKGKAVKEAILMSRGRYIVILDTDLWDDKFVSESLVSLQKYDILLGSKNLPGSLDTRPFIHRLRTKLYNFAFRLLFNLKVTDTKAKMAFVRENILPVIGECRTEDLLFDTELIIRAERKGLSEKEIPTEVREIRPQRYSVVNHQKQILRDFITLLRVLRPSPNWAYLLLGAAFILGAYLRFFHYTDWFFYEVDEEHYSYMARMITVNHHLPLIGGPISGTHLYMAPWFLYFSAFWFMLAGNSPISYGFITTIIGLSTLLFIYLIGKKVSSPSIGALGALLYAGSFMMVLFDRHQWNVTLLPLISVSTFYFLLRYKDNGIKWLPVASLIVAFGISSTFTALAVFLFTFMFVLFVKKPFLKKDVFVFLGVIVLTHLSLIIFDLRHDFWLTRALGDFLFHPAYSSLPLASRLINTLSIAGESFGKAIAITNPLDVADESSICTAGVMRFISSWPFIFSAIIFLSASFLLALRKKLSSVTFYIFILLAVNTLSLIFFRADPSERHWLPFYPFLFLLVSSVLVKIWETHKLGKITTLLIISGILLLNIYSYLSSWTSYGWENKFQAVKYIIANTKPDRFYLDSLGECHKWGYRYQFSLSNHEPAGSYLDADFAWMYNYIPNPSLATIKATIISPNKNSPEPVWLTTNRNKLMENSFKKEKFGNVEVYLEPINVKYK